MTCVRCLNHGTHINEQISLSLCWKGVAMHSNTWRCCQFRLHTRGLKPNTIIPRFSYLIFLSGGRRRGPRQSDKRRNANVAIAPSSPSATDVRMAEADDRPMTIIAVSRMRNEGIRPQAYKTQRQVGTTETISTPIYPD